MMLQYRIVVVDDQPTNIKVALRELKQDMEQEGFEAVPEIVNTPEGYKTLSTRNDLAGNVDLLLVDKQLALGQNQDGATVIRRLRARAPHIPVIFYSAEPADTLRKRIAAEGIDGVYCCYRPDLRIESLNIFRAQISSLLRPHAVRGFIVGGVSELDHQMRDAIRLCVSYLKQSGSALLREEVIRQLEKSREALVSQIEIIKASADLDVVLDGRNVTSAHLPVILQKLLDQFPDQRMVAAFVPVLREYITEVIEPRNVLAHGRQHESGNFVQLENRKVGLDQSATREQRARLRRHSHNVKSLIAQVNKISSASPGTRPKLTQENKSGPAAAVEKTAAVATADGESTTQVRSRK